MFLGPLTVSFKTGNLKGISGHIRAILGHYCCFCKLGLLEEWPILQIPLKKVKAHANSGPMGNPKAQNTANI